MGKFKSEKDIWPFGLKTDTCPTCNGTGGRSNAMKSYIESQTRGTVSIDAIRCSFCGGRGRVIVEGTAEQRARR